MAWQKALPSKRNAAFLAIGLQVLNIIFVSALAGVVATQLDYQNGKCLLNSKGQVCIFTYITAGAAILFALLTAIPAAYFYSRGEALFPVYLSLAVFSFFWQLVMAITITIRGGQAEDAGLAKQSAREQAYAFAWLGVSFSFLTAIVVLLDLIRESITEKKIKTLQDNNYSVKVDDIHFMNAGVGVGAV